MTAKGRGDLRGHVVLKAEELPSNVGLRLASINEAIMQFKRVKMVYDALYSGDVTERVVDPYYLFFQDGFWNIRAYCNLRKEFRTFALDRIVSLEVLDNYFVPQSVSLEDDLSGSFAAFVDGEPTDVVLRFDEAIKNEVIRKRWHQSQEQIELDDGRLEIHFHVNGLEGIMPWINRWVPYVEVISPAELRKAVHGHLKEALKKYE